jgi:hypothetical protein
VVPSQNLRESEEEYSGFSSKDGREGRERRVGREMRGGNEYFHMKVFLSSRYQTGRGLAGRKCHGQ